MMMIGCSLKIFVLNTVVIVIVKDLEVISSKLIDNKIAIGCYTSDYNCGGDLVLIADDIMIFDESGYEITYDKLNNIDQNYWNSFN